MSLLKYLTSNSIKNQVVIGLVFGVPFACLLAWGLYSADDRIQRNKENTLTELRSDKAELTRENAELQETINTLRSEWKEIIREVLDERKG